MWSCWFSTDSMVKVTLFLLVSPSRFLQRKKITAWSRQLWIHIFSAFQEEKKICFISNSRLLISASPPLLSTNKISSALSIKADLSSALELRIISHTIRSLLSLFFWPPASPPTCTKIVTWAHCDLPWGCVQYNNAVLPRISPLLTYIYARR